MARPQTLDEFKGQKKIKPRIEMSMRSAKLKGDAFPHTLLVGPAGLGKTTLAQVIANEMKSQCFTYMGPGIKTRDDINQIVQAIVSVLSPDNCKVCGDSQKKSREDAFAFGEVEPCKHNGGYAKDGEVVDLDLITPVVVFIDEIHRVSTKLQEIMYTMIEDRIYYTGEKDYDGKEMREWLPLFTLIGATTLAGNLSKPMIDRFRMVLNFEPYTPEECIDIVKEAIGEEGMTCSKNAALEIGKRTGGVPRRVIAMAKNAVDVAISRESRKITSSVVGEMFKMHGIDKLGFNDIHRRELQILFENTGQPMGIAGIALAINESDKMLAEQIEPKLIQEKMIIRTPRGRMISEAGIEYIKRFMRPGTKSGAGSRVMKNEQKYVPLILDKKEE